MQGKEQNHQIPAHVSGEELQGAVLDLRQWLLSVMSVSKDENVSWMS